MQAPGRAHNAIDTNSTGWYHKSVNLLSPRLDLPNRRTSEERASIWSLLSGWWLWTYHAAFSVQMAIITVRAIWIEVILNDQDSLVQTYLGINQEVGPYIIPAAGLAFVGVLVGEIGYMIVEPFMKWREKVGRNRANDEWESWLNSSEDLRNTIEKLIREGKIDVPPSQNGDHRE